MEKLKVIKVFVISITTAITMRLGSLAVPVYILLTLMIMDYFTALGAAGYRKQKWSSRVGFWGIVKKLYMLTLILLGIVMDIFINYTLTSLDMHTKLNNTMAIAIALWLVVNEIISVLENINDILGEKVPKWLKPLLGKMRSKIEERLVHSITNEIPETEENRGESKNK